MRTLLALSFLTFALNADAADIKNLSENFPLPIEDAFAVDRGDFQGQLSSDYKKDEDDQFIFTPDFEYGVAENLQLEVGSEMIHGISQRNGSGDVYIGALYELPVDFTALAVKGTLIAPTGIGSKGIGTELGLLSSLLLSEKLRTHLDLRWLHNGETQPGERDNGFRSSFGLQHIYNDQTSSVIAVVREVQLEQDQEYNLFEIGCLHSLSEKLAGGAAIAAGLGDDSPDFVARIAIQQEF